MGSRVLSVLSVMTLFAATACSSSSKKSEDSAALARAESDAASMRQSTAASRSAMSPNRVMDELAFNQLHHMNQKEIAMAELAQRKSRNDEVKQNAQMVMKEHQNMDQQVKSVAEQMDFELADFTPSTHEKSLMSRLEQLDGADFDRAFMDSMMLSHQMAQDQLKALRRSTSTAQVSAVIDQALPQVQKHQLASKRLTASFHEGTGASGLAE